MKSKHLYIELAAFVFELFCNKLISISQLTNRFMIYGGYFPKPSNNLAKMRLESEEGWLKLGQDLGLSTYVFRLGGIYGPGRRLTDIYIQSVMILL